MLLFISITVYAQDYTDTIDFFGSDDAAFLFGLGLSMCLIIIIIPLIIAILICIWIYKDAESRGKSGALWVILLILATLLFNIIGLIVICIIWLAVRPPPAIGGTQINQTVQNYQQQQYSDRRCPSCGRAIPNDARVCPYCGKNFDSQ